MTTETRTELTQGRPRPGASARAASASVALTIAVVLSATANAAPEASAAPKASAAPDAAAAPAKPAAPVQEPLEFIRATYKQLDELTRATQGLAALHDKIGDAMQGFMDYDEMARRTLARRWEGLTAKQRAEYVGLLEKMVRESYVKRFEPGKPVEVRWDSRVKRLKDGRAQVRTSVQIGRSSADVAYSMHLNNGAWRVYDLVIDEASQVATYKRSFAKILDKEGWDGLMRRMRKSVADH